MILLICKNRLSIFGEQTTTLIMTMTLGVTIDDILIFGITSIVTPSGRAKLHRFTSPLSNDRGRRFLRRPMILSVSHGLPCRVRGSLHRFNVNITFVENPALIRCTLGRIHHACWLHASLPIFTLFSSPARLFIRQ